MTTDNNTAASDSTEDIINSVLDEAFGNTQTTDPGTGNEQQTHPTVEGQAQSASTNPATNDGNGAAGTGSPANNQSQGQQDPTRQGTQAPINPGRVRDDGQGNLVDAQGNLVARRGVERRWYSEAQGASRQLQQTQQELEGLRSQLQTYEKAYATFQNLQLPPQDIAIGAQLYKSFQTNPRATIEYLMTEARKNGVQLDGLGASVDTQAIRAMLADELAPMRQEREQRQRAAEADQAAEKEYNEFINNPQYPHAQIHEDAIARVMQINPQASLAEAYLNLRVAALEAGLDFSKPLAPQWAAKRNGQQNNNQRSGAPANNTGNQPSVPLPNGRPAGGARVSINSPRVAPSNANNADIVREALREAGLQ